MLVGVFFMFRIPDRYMDKIVNDDYKNVIAELDDCSIDVLLTDPPYNIRINGKRWDEGFDLKEWINLVLPKVASDGMVMIFNTKDNIDRIIKESVESFHDSNHDFTVVDTIEWGKTNPRLNIDLVRQYEFVLIAYNNYNTSLNSREFEGDFNPVFDNDVWETATELKMFKANSDHPTAKPVRLLNNLIYKYTQPGDVLLDTTSGTGSIELSAYFTHRHFVACELDEDYAKDSVTRLNSFKSRVPRSIFVKNLENDIINKNEKVEFFHSDIFTTDIYGKELEEKVQSIYGGETNKFKRWMTVKALHKFELNQNLSAEEQLIISLFEENIRLNLYEFVDTGTDYSDYKMFEYLGYMAVVINEYDAQEVLKEFEVLVNLNREDFRNKYIINDSEKIVRKVIKYIISLPELLQKDNREVNTINLLDKFQIYLKSMDIALGNGFDKHYYIYKGWKMVSVIRNRHNKNLKHTLDNRKRNLSNEWKVAQFRLSDVNKITFCDYLLEDLKKFEFSVIQDLVYKRFGYSEDVALEYFKLVLSALFIRSGDNMVKNYLSYLVRGYFNSDTEGLITKAILDVEKSYKKKYWIKDKKKTFKIKQLGVINELLHITTKKAEKNDLQFLYLYTSDLSQETKKGLKSNNIPHKREKYLADCQNKRVSLGEKVWKLHVKDKKSFKQISDEKLIDMDRELISERFYSYVRYKFNVLDLNGQAEKYGDFKSMMGLTDRQFEKNIPHN